MPRNSDIGCHGKASVDACSYKKATKTSDEEFNVSRVSVAYEAKTIIYYSTKMAWIQLIFLGCDILQ